MHEFDQRLARLAEYSGGLPLAVTRLDIEQYRLHPPLEISTHVLRAAVVVEYFRDARHVRGAGIARHQALDEPRGDERSDIGMMENAVERGGEFGLRARGV